jgi:DNA-3-methyladenine glycosylase II
VDPQILKHFQKVDPTLFSLAKQTGVIKSLSPRPLNKYFSALCSDIISQQLSNRVGEIFWTRFVNLFPRKRVSPEILLSLPNPTLRSIGVSNSKVNYLKSLADHFVNKKINFNNLKNLTDEEVIGELTKIKGIGRWTAEMFLMFTLARPDVFSSGDQGLKNAIRKHYVKAPNPNLWSPYKTSACLILWASLDQ